MTIYLLVNKSKIFNIMLGFEQSFYEKISKMKISRSDV